MRTPPEISGVSVVLVGNFNPAIFTPAWFAQHELLPQEVAENAELQIAHPEVTEFSTEWLRLQTTTDRFSASTLRVPYVRVRDLVLRVFNEHLYHTPIRALGINRDVHFEVASPDARDRIGRLLAPVEPWEPLRDKLELDNETGGMLSLTMSQSHPEDRPTGGKVDITVEPSNRIAGGRSGIYVRVNDHFEIDGNASDNRSQLMEFLDKRFDCSIKFSEDIVDHIMSL